MSDTIPRFVSQFTKSNLLYVYVVRVCARPAHVTHPIAIDDRHRNSRRPQNKRPQKERRTETVRTLAPEKRTHTSENGWTQHAERHTNQELKMGIVKPVF